MSDSPAITPPRPESLALFASITPESGDFSTTTDALYAAAQAVHEILASTQGRVLSIQGLFRAADRVEDSADIYAHFEGIKMKSANLLATAQECALLLDRMTDISGRIDTMGVDITRSMVTRDQRAIPGSTQRPDGIASLPNLAIPKLPDGEP